MEEERGKEELFLVSLQELILQAHEDQHHDFVKKIEEITGYQFHDPTLLQQAFTHHSYQEGCTSYERLEYVGDAVLNLLITKEHYFLYPDLGSGNLTRLRAANVDTEKLARVALNHQLHRFLRHNIPLLAERIKEFTNAVVEYPLHSWGLIDAPKVLANMVESLVGAIYVDSDSSMDTAWKVVRKLLEPVITPATLQLHPRTKLHELCQKNRLKVKIRDSWKETGEVEFFVAEELVGKGKHDTKKEIALSKAAQSAYLHILEKLKLENISQDHG